MYGQGVHSLFVSPQIICLYLGGVYSLGAGKVERVYAEIHYKSEKLRLPAVDTVWGLVCIVTDFAAMHSQSSLFLH